MLVGRRASRSRSTSIEFDRATRFTTTAPLYSERGSGTIRSNRKTPAMSRGAIRLTSFLCGAVRICPERWRSLLHDKFFLHVPIRPLVRYTICQYAGYLQHGLPGKGDTVIDGGAYLGNFAILAARLVGRRGRVIALEPDPATAQALRSRMEQLGLGNVQVVAKGLWDKEEEIPFYMHEGVGLSSLFPSETDQPARTSIQCTSLDALVADLQLERVDFVKMDVEGAEIEALSGASDTLTRHHPAMAVATYHERDGALTSAKVEQQLASLGYTVTTDWPWHLTTYAAYRP